MTDLNLAIALWLGVLVGLIGGLAIGFGVDIALWCIN
jgi:hypothetical protein